MHDRRKLLFVGCGKPATLVQIRISQLHPEIRRTMDHTYKDQLKGELERQTALLARLKSLEDAGDDR